MSIETVPTDLRNLRACLVCSLVKTLHQFEMDGCDNCDRFLGIKGDIEKCVECTSANFDGMIAVCDHNDSWVSKWQVRKILFYLKCGFYFSPISLLSAIILRIFCKFADSWKTCIF
ncbi:unnamed protein product [Meloidogyne enterolobii]|uniref:Uncharacterized protein n=1 Tax=Meloidogyne enterolobii TaxID=390850 RepID=A0ACB0YJX3_MELEN